MLEAERGERTVGDICRENGVSEQTFYRWRQKYGGLEVSEAKRLREMERLNTRLKRLLANRDLEVNALKELLAKSGKRTGKSRVLENPAGFRTTRLLRCFKFNIDPGSPWQNAYGRCIGDKFRDLKGG